MESNSCPYSADCTMSLMVGGHGWWMSRSGRDGGSSSGKSAVQLLQESKSQYVKSDHVLETSQEPACPDRFHISSNPNIFLKAPAHTLHTSRLSPDPSRKTSTAQDESTEPKTEGKEGKDEVDGPAPQPVTVAILTPSALAQHAIAMNKSGGALPLRIQRGAPRPRAKTQPIGDQFNRGTDIRRSLSHGPGDRGEDVQMKLRKLLDVGSKEQIYPESPSKQSHPGFPTADEIINGTGTFRAEPVTVTVHKSLPDIWKTTSSDINSNKGDVRRPSCPPNITMEKQPKGVAQMKVNNIKDKSPPPVPPRKSKEASRPLPDLPQNPPDIPRRVSLDPTPPKLPPRTNKVVVVSKSPEESKTVAQIAPTIEIHRRNSDSDVSAAGGSEELRRRPILRSKSDVTHERCLLGQQRDDESFGSRTSINEEDLKQFFESMGLDNSTYQELISSNDKEDPNSQYFEEDSSTDSIPRRCSSEEEGQPNADAAALRPGEPSIVEKNARIIKWLFTCQRALKGTTATSQRIATLST